MKPCKEIIKKYIEPMKVSIIEKKHKINSSNWSIKNTIPQHILLLNKSKNILLLPNLILICPPFKGNDEKTRINKLLNGIAKAYEDNIGNKKNNE